MKSIQLKYIYRERNSKELIATNLWENFCKQKRKKRLEHGFLGYLWDCLYKFLPNILKNNFWHLHFLVHKVCTLMTLHMIQTQQSFRKYKILHQKVFSEKAFYFSNLFFWCSKVLSAHSNPFLIKICSESQFALSISFLSFYRWKNKQIQPLTVGDF